MSLVSNLGKQARMLQNLQRMQKPDQITQCQNCKKKFLTPVTNIEDERKRNVNRMKHDQIWRLVVGFESDLKGHCWVGDMAWF